MTTFQKIIKYLALALAVCLVFTIVTGGLSLMYSLFTAFNGSSDVNNKEVGVVWQEDGSSILELNIDVTYSNLTIKTGDGFMVETNNGNVKCKLVNNTLKVTEGVKLGFKSSKSEVIVYVPTRRNINKIKISAGAGNITIDELSSDVIDFDLGAGRTVIQKIVSKDADIDTGAGSISILSGDISNLNLDTGAGEVNVSSIIRGNSRIDTGIGNVRLDLKGSSSDYRFNVNKGIGNVMIDNVNVSDGNIGSGSSFISLNGGIGTTTVTFS